MYCQEYHESYITFYKSVEESRQKKLYCLASGAPVSEEIEKDILRGWWAWKDSKKHIHTGTLETWTWQKLKTTEGVNNKPLTTSQGKLIHCQEQQDLTFKLLVKSQTLNVPIDLDVLHSYSSSPVPYCLGNPFQRQIKHLCFNFS